MLILQAHQNANDVTSPQASFSQHLPPDCAIKFIWLRQYAFIWVSLVYNITPLIENNLMFSKKKNAKIESMLPHLTSF